jgi:hypothetical protein
MPVDAKSGLKLETTSDGKYENFISPCVENISSAECIRNCTLPDPMIDRGEMQAARVADIHVAGTIDKFPKIQDTLFDH